MSQSFGPRTVSGNNLRIWKVVTHIAKPVSQGSGAVCGESTENSTPGKPGTLHMMTTVEGFKRCKADRCQECLELLHA